MQPQVVPSLILSFLLATVACGQSPIEKVDGTIPKKGVLRSANAKKPLEIRSAKEAAKHFDEDNLAKLKKKVDFAKQFVLVFTWRGSGQDRLKYAVAESYPEQIFFTYKRGRTRDLRQHIYVFALRSNVKWSVK